MAHEDLSLADFTAAMELLPGSESVELPKALPTK